ADVEEVGFVDTGGGVVVADTKFDVGKRGIGDEVGAGDDDGVGAAEGARGFAEEAAGENVVVAERVYGADQDQIEVAVDAAMLEGVVEDEDFGVGAFCKGGVRAGNSV